MLFISLLSPLDPTQAGQSEPLQQSERRRRREGESEAFSWEKINIRSLSSCSSPVAILSSYLNVSLDVACGFYYVMSFISCSGAAGELFRIAALIGHADGPSGMNLTSKQEENSFFLLLKRHFAFEGVGGLI